MGILHGHPVLRSHLRVLKSVRIRRRGIEGRGWASIRVDRAGTVGLLWG